MTRKALLQLCQTTEQQRAALDSVQTAVDAFNLLLDGVYEEYCQN
jgi:pyrroloquinoline-quinone synthase